MTYFLPRDYNILPKRNYIGALRNFSVHSGLSGFMEHPMNLGVVRPSSPARPRAQYGMLGFLKKPSMA